MLELLNGATPTATPSTFRTMHAAGVCTAVLAIVVCATAAGSAVAAGRPASTVRAQLVLETAQDRLRAKVDLSWRIPLGKHRVGAPGALAKSACDERGDGANRSPSALVQALAQLSHDDSRYPCARGRLLRATGLFELLTKRLPFYSTARDGLAHLTVSITHSTALVRVRARTWVSSQFPTVVGPFVIGAPDGDNHLEVWVSRENVPVRTRRVIELRASHMRSSATPVPQSAGTGWAVWETEPGSGGAATLIVSLPTVVRWTLATRDAPILRWLATVLGMLPALLLAVLTAVLAGRSRRARWAAIALAATVLAAIVGVSATDLLFGSFGNSLKIEATTATLLIAAIVALALASAWKRRRALALVAGALVVVVATTSYYAQGLGLGTQAVMLSGAYATALAVAVLAIARIATFPLPAPPRAGLVLAGLVIVGLAFATGAQWIVQGHRTHDFDPGFLQTYLTFDDPLGSLRGMVTEAQQQYWLPLRVLTIVVGLVPLGILGAALHELRAHHSPRHTLRSDRGAYLLVTLLFAAFVVGTGGQRWGLTLPLGLVLTTLVLWQLRDRLSARRVALLEALPASEPSPLTRALRSERARSGRRELYKRWHRGELNDAEHAAGDARLQDQMPLLGPMNGGREPREIALARGPGGGWLADGEAAVCAAAALLIVPVSYYVFVVTTHGTDATGPGYTAPVDLASGVAYEVAFWVVAAFCFGAAFSMLPTVTGVSKGVSVALAYFVLAWPLSVALPAEDQVGLAFRLFELVLFLCLLGIRLDLRTVGRGGLRDLALLYRIQEIGPALIYVAPLVTSVIVIADQLRSGNAADAVREAIRSVPNLAPPVSR